METNPGRSLPAAGAGGRAADRHPLRLVNRTKNVVVAEDLRIPHTLIEKSIGLLREPEPASLLLRTRWGIHTVGMRFPIDCAVLDARLVVRSVRHALPPDRLFLWNPRFPFIAELPPGTLRSTGTELGDAFEITEGV